MKMSFLYLILGIIIILILLFIYYYNRIVVLENRIDNAKAQIEVQLKKRADLVPNLIETVKGYVKHERGLLEEITKLRSKVVRAKDLEKKAKAGQELQGAIERLMVVVENYPNLKANENFLQLQQELGDIEDKIAYARQFYNDTVMEYNNLIETFPAVLIANMLGKKEKRYLEIDEKSKEVPKVSF